MSAWSKLPRSILGVLGFEGWQTAGLNALNNRGQCHECLVEPAAEHFRGFGGLRLANGRLDGKQRAAA